MKSLQIKLGLNYAVIVCISVAASVVAALNFLSIERSVRDMYAEGYRGMFTAENLLRALQKQDNAQMAMFVDDIDVARMYRRDHRDAFLRSYDEALHAADSLHHPPVLDSILVTYRTYLKHENSLDSIITLRGPVQVAKDYQFAIVRPVAEKLKEQCFSYLDYHQGAVVTIGQMVKERAADSSLLAILASLLNIALSIIAGTWFARTIVRPLAGMTRTVRGISRNRFDQKIDIVSDDEIGQLATEFNKMTERLRVYEQMNISRLVAEKSKSEAIVASISDPLVVVDCAGVVMLANPAARRLLPRAVAGIESRSAFPDESWRAALTETGEPGDGAAEQDALLTREEDGEQRFYRPRRRTIRDEQGEATGVVTMLQDVTRFKQLENLKSEFLATVSHEFRTPLTSINMTVDILLNQVLGSLTPRQHELLDGAKQDCERLKKLVEQLLDLSRLESGRADIRRERVRIRDVVDGALRPLLLPMHEKKLELTVDVDERLPPVHGDPEKLQWVVSNLVGNALRYCDEGGAIAIRAVLEGRSIAVSVRDNGRGIPRDALPTIFDTFVQLKDRDETTPGSVGLGLAIARRVVLAHGGVIRAESEPGAGSTFTFTLPVEG